VARRAAQGRLAGSPSEPPRDNGGAAEVAKQDIDVHMSFRVSSLENFVTRLEQMQVRYVNLKGEERKMTTRLDGVKQVYFQDPDGYWIEVNDNKF
jgi:lactoylglutathione lyase